MVSAVAGSPVAASFGPQALAHSILKSRITATLTAGTLNCASSSGTPSESGLTATGCARTTTANARTRTINRITRIGALLIGATLAYVAVHENLAARSTSRKDGRA